MCNLRCIPVHGIHLGLNNTWYIYLCTCIPGVRFPAAGCWEVELGAIILLNPLKYQQMHGLINYLDTKAKCRHLKKSTCKGTLRKMFIKVHGLIRCWYFRPSFVNCCPSNLLSGSTVPPPLSCMNKYTVYTYTVCKGGGRGSRPQTDNHLPQSPFTGQFFWWRHLWVDSIYEQMHVLYCVRGHMFA